MGGLRPIGSEKLSGMDKIRRIMEIATYDTNKGNLINEDKENVFSVKFADGINYVIAKEKQGYIIKESSDKETQYLESIQERKYYSSYSQALKRLNLMAKEVNTLFGNDKGTALFEESEKKKYYLDLGDKKKEETKTQSPTTGTAPQPAAPVGTTTAPLEEQGDPTLDPTATPPVPAPAAAPAVPAPESAVAPPLPTGEPGMEGEDMGLDEPEDGMEMEPEDEEGKKEEITFKLIQKLTGKLSQKLRTYGEDKEMSSDNIKYVINSIISAIDVDSLDEEDIEEIISRLEGEEEEDEEGMEGMDDEGMEEEPMGGMGPEPGLEGPPPSPEGIPSPGGEMAEGFKNLSDAFVNKFKGAYSSVLKDKMLEGERRLNRRKKHSYNGTFGESSVDKIISKYFDIKEDEYLIKEEETIKRIEFIKEKNTREIKRLSESLRQERMAFKFIERFPKARLIGSTNNKNLVFKQGLVERKITPSGNVL